MAFSPLLSPSPLHSSCSRLSFSAHNDRALEQGKREVGTALRDRGQQERAGSAAKPPSNRTVAGQGSPGGGVPMGYLESGIPSVTLTSHASVTSWENTHRL